MTNFKTLELENVGVQEPFETPQYPSLSLSQGCTQCHPQWAGSLPLLSGGPCAAQNLWCWLCMFLINASHVLHHCIVIAIPGPTLIQQLHTVLSLFAVCLLFSEKHQSQELFLPSWGHHFLSDVFWQLMNDDLVHNGHQFSEVQIGKCACVEHICGPSVVVYRELCTSTWQVQVCSCPKTLNVEYFKSFLGLNTPSQPWNFDANLKSLITLHHARANMNPEQLPEG